MTSADPSATPPVSTTQTPRDRGIALRKADLIGGLLAQSALEDGDQARLRQFGRMLGAILHYDYFEELERLRTAYRAFDPEIDDVAGLDLDLAYRDLSREITRVLADANFVELTHEEIIRDFAERPLLRVKISAPLEDFRDVRMFRRGCHEETVEVPRWFGLRKDKRAIEVYDDVVLMVATKPQPTAAKATRGARRIKPGAVLFKYFRHIARCDLHALFPNVRVVMSMADRLTLGVPAIFGGIPILIKLASTLTVLFLVAGFYLGLIGTIQADDEKQALAALSGLFALGAFLLRQWGNFHRQSLMHEKQITDNIYYRNVNNNSGIFNYLIGEAEEQEWQETLLAYYALLSAPAPLTPAALKERIADLLTRGFSIAAEVAVDNAIGRLRELDLLNESGDGLVVIPLDAALARLSREWTEIFDVGDQKAARPAG